MNRRLRAGVAGLVIAGAVVASGNYVAAQPSPPSPLMPTPIPVIESIVLVQGQPEGEPSQTLAVIGPLTAAEIPVALADAEAWLDAASLHYEADEVEWSGSITVAPMLTPGVPLDEWDALSIAAAGQE